MKRDSIVHQLTLTGGASYWELVGVVSHSQEAAGNLAPNHKTDEHHCRYDEVQGGNRDHDGDEQKYQDYGVHILTSSAPPFQAFR